MERRYLSKRGLFESKGLRYVFMFSFAYNIQKVVNSIKMMCKSMTPDMLVSRRPGAHRQGIMSPFR